MNNKYSTIKKDIYVYYTTCIALNNKDTARRLQSQNGAILYIKLIMRILNILSSFVRIHRYGHGSNPNKH